MVCLVYEDFRIVRTTIIPEGIPRLVYSTVVAVYRIGILPRLVVQRRVRLLDEYGSLVPRLFLRMAGSASGG